eukprot:3159574-Rhodomonas_salina.4
MFDIAGADVDYVAVLGWAGRVGERREGGPSGRRVSRDGGSQGGTALLQWRRETVSRGTAGRGPS